jgi:Rod binding domain-containing protein
MNATNPTASLHGSAKPEVSAEKSSTELERSKARQAAQDFEAIFVRQLLQPLEKAKSLSGKSDPGGQIYGSMMVGALADTATRGAGFGLADIIAAALTPPTPPNPPLISGPPSVGPTQ